MQTSGDRGDRARRGAVAQGLPQTSPRTGVGSPASSPRFRPTSPILRRSARRTPSRWRMRANYRGDRQARHRSSPSPGLTPGAPWHARGPIQAASRRNPPTPVDGLSTSTRASTPTNEAWRSISTSTTARAICHGSIGSGSARATTSAATVDFNARGRRLRSSEEAQRCGRVAASLLCSSPRSTRATATRLRNSRRISPSEGAARWKLEANAGRP